MTETNDAEQNPDPHGIGAIKPSQYKIGDRVRYYPVLPDGEVPQYEETRIRSEPWQLGNGAWVIKVEGRSGGVSTEHLCPTPEASETTPPKPAALDEAVALILDRRISMAAVNQAMVDAAMRAHGGNQTAAAAHLGLTRDQLRYRLSKGRDKQNSA